MKGTDNFKKVISDYLDSFETQDPLFAQRRKEVNRSIDDIVKYIINEVYKSGCNGFDDAEIYGMAIHAAEEPDLLIGKDANPSHVTINHHVEFTEEEKKEQRELALKRFQDEEYRKYQERNQRKTASKPQSETQPTLFDF